MYENFDIGYDLKMAFEDGYRVGVEAAQPRWISVIDELPVPDTRVIVSAIDNDGESIVAITEYTHRLYGLGLTGWIEPWQYFSYNYKITHWMPLPEAQKDGD